MNFEYKKDKIFLEGVKGERITENIKLDNDSFELVNFYRQGDNFGYVKGIVEFLNNCSNNVVVSDQEKQ